ncbi:MAG: ribosomal RNA small subunit methyltransferase A [Candidatus Zambryskibacteria bacterium]|nr:ribosomal RNA small subunit methyltransferase A [Candidatus Zambryskibacteria bacterium]
MRVKKSLGQHFLRSERALNKIIEAGKISPEDLILEIGPGRGVLTEKLLQTGAEVTAVEKDDELYEFLRDKFHKEISSGQLNLIHDDILDFDFKNYQLEPSTYKLVANIPYNITGAILEKFLSSEYQPESLVLLVQKEVAQRIVAQNQKESILSISVKAYGTPRYVETVRAGSFVPAPKVDSAIIKIDRISKDFFQNTPKNNNLEVELPSEEKFFKLVKAGFQSKRKKLSSNLGVIFDKNRIKKTFEMLNLSENARAEEISPEMWQKLAISLL